MRVSRPFGKTTLQKMMEEEAYLSKAAGCPPGHTYNPVIKKCLPGSPLSGISYGGGGDYVSIMPIERIVGDKALEMENLPKKSAPKKIRMAGEAMQNKKSA